MFTFVCKILVYTIIKHPPNKLLYLNLTLSLTHTLNYCTLSYFLYAHTENYCTVTYLSHLHTIHYRTLTCLPYTHSKLLYPKSELPSADSEQPTSYNDGRYEVFSEMNMVLVEEISTLILNG